MKPAIADFIRREVRRVPRPLTAPEVYPIPSAVLDEESVAWHFHHDLPRLDWLELLGELPRLEFALRLVPRGHLDREWYVERHRRVTAEIRRRRRRST